MKFDAVRTGRTEKKRKREIKKSQEKNRLFRQQLLCIAAGVFLFAVYPMTGSKTEFLKEGGVIERNSYGQGETEGTVLVEGLSQKDTELSFTLKERQYSRKEAFRQFDLAIEEVKKIMAGENESLTSVTMPLNLPSRLDSLGMGLKWETENPQLLDSDGTIQEEALKKELEKTKKEQVETSLFLTIEAGDYKKQYEIPIILKMPEQTEEERLKTRLLEKIKELDEEQKYEESIRLPAEIEGKKIFYKNKRDWGRFVFPVLGVSAAVALQFQGISRQKEEKKKRNTRLLLDYSDIVSELCVYLNAGFPVRRAWEQLAEEYSAFDGRQEGRKKAGYEEIAASVRAMNQGMPEIRAYGEFGRRCGLRPYRKLAGLMSQYVKNGSGSLLKSLEEEMEAAFEERKEAARRAGEEKGTKLLLPLFMMLMVVMVMVSVPAFLTFGL